MRGVAFQEILLELYVHSFRPEPFPVVVEQADGILAAAFHQRRGQRAVAPAGEQCYAISVFREVGRVQPGLAAVVGAGQGEQAGEVGVSLASPGQQRDAGAVASWTARRR